MFVYGAFVGLGLPRAAISVIVIRVDVKQAWRPVSCATTKPSLF